MTSVLAKEVRGAFDPGGGISRALPGFEPRPGQVRLAAAWAEAIARGGILVAEAATGIGKTLAYLVPVVLSGRKAIVSTGTKTLQQQLVENDIPVVREALRVPFSCVLVKGRANYLCRRRWKRFSVQPLFEFAREASLFDRMRAFAETTRTGDLSECPGIPEDFRAWNEVNARSEMCDASACAESDRCYLMEVRRRAAEADLVVVNHHLFFADLALRSKAEGAPDILPLPDAVVIDEAHGMEEVASSFFGVTVSLWRAQELCRDIVRSCGKAGEGWRPALPAAEALRRAAEMLFGSAGEAQGRFFLPEPSADASFDRRSEDLSRAGQELCLALAACQAGRDAGGNSVGLPSGDADLLARRARSFVEDFSALRSPDPGGTVAWGERKGHSVAFCRTPVEVSGVLAATMWRESVPFLLTSATLSVSRNLSYFRERVGLGAVDAKELIVDNEFDFARRALAYVPSGLPDPGEEGFPAAAAGEVAAILSASGGGALILCTSYRTLGALDEALREDLPFTLYVQGEAPRTHLLRAFREEEDAVLIGTGTFWEGIDVPGESLRCVIIDKLPFAPPADPVVSARIRAVRERGGDPFADYQVPEAVLALRQGVGRLLRRGDDFGAVAILDRRVFSRSYGETFRRNLPEMTWTRDREAVKSFFLRFRGNKSSPGKEGSG
ncbi:MAG: ATP-dependent DNA helicase [Deltaproteobacteria bacterium]|nr:ATP-dependent DNA helicase [Deltaproteobacteria bacterium]